MKTENYLPFCNGFTILVTKLLNILALSYLLSGETLLAPFHVSRGLSMRIFLTLNEPLQHSYTVKQLPLEKLAQPTGPITLMKVSKSLFLAPTKS